MKGKPISRRAMLARSAAAVPVFVPASALGADARPAANDRITMGAIGLGGMGTGDALSFARGTQMLAGCDPVESKRDAFKVKIDALYGNRDSETYDDFRELIARDDIDAVCIATPDHWHAIIAIEAMKAGKDVFCEKPLSLTIREARAMVDTARRYGRVFQTHNNRRREARNAARLIWAGAIGELREVYVRTWETCGPCDLPPEPVPPGVDWDMWLGPAPWRPFHSRLISFNFRPYFDYSGGNVTDWGAHQFDKVQFVLRTQHTGPVEIHPPGSEDEDYVVMRYANGIRVRYFAAPRSKRVPSSWRPEMGNVWFKGTKGVVSEGGRTDPPELAKKPLPPDAPRVDIPSMTGNFLHCLRTRERPTSDVEIGARAATVCHLANIALWTGRSLRWDPQKEVFPDDEAASRWLDRPKREPWRL